LADLRIRRDNARVACREMDRELREKIRPLTEQIRGLREEEKKELPEDTALWTPPPEPSTSKTRSLGTPNDHPYKRDFEAKIRAEISRLQKNLLKDRIEVKTRIESLEIRSRERVARLETQRDEGLTEDEWNIERRLWRHGNPNTPD
jgi:hypothetical protein